jgi:hypothetical protein
MKSLKEIVETLRNCGYTCEAGPLENNVDFQLLEQIAGYNGYHAVNLDGREISKLTGVEIWTREVYGKLTAQSPQDIRDEIIEKAKRDVAEIEREYPGNKISDIKLIVSKEKRTTVALWKRMGVVVRRGIAKCDPSDCFNVHIGKAIALRRALGLEMPSEYLNAPQPTEVRVGDVVETYNCTGGGIHRIFKVARVKVESGGIYLYENKNSLVFTEFLTDFGDRVIDDSREEVTE